MPETTFPLTIVNSASLVRMLFLGKRLFRIEGTASKCLSKLFSLEILERLRSCNDQYAVPASLYESAYHRLKFHDPYQFFLVIGHV